MKSLRSAVNCLLVDGAKSLIYGSGGGTRTPDTRIMISHAPLFFLGYFGNHSPSAPYYTDAARKVVNPKYDPKQRISAAPGLDINAKELRHAC